MSACRDGKPELKPSKILPTVGLCATEPPPNKYRIYKIGNNWFLVRPYESLPCGSAGYFESTRRAYLAELSGVRRVGKR